MFTFVRDATGALGGHTAPTLFMAFFAYVWVVWTSKTLATAAIARGATARLASEPP